MKGILRQFSVARTPQQNRVAERRNKTRIEAARIMLADSKLPTTFWAKAVNTVCYVQNRVLVVKPHNKTPYELFHGRKPTLSFMRPFGCLVTILNTIDQLGKFYDKVDEGFFDGYSLTSKAFKVFNSRTRIVEENLHIRFSESALNVVGSGPDWIFDINALTRTINYEPIVTGTQSNGIAGIKASNNAGQARKETELVKDYILYHYGLLIHHFPKIQRILIMMDPNFQVMMERRLIKIQEKKINIIKFFDPNMPALEDVSIFNFLSDDEDDGTVADMNNLDTTIQVSPIPSIRIHKDHPLDQKRAIGTKWGFRNKKDEMGIMIRNKERLVAQGYTQEEAIDYDEVFTLISRIEAIRLFLAYASFKYFMVYQIDVKSDFLYEKIEEEVYVYQPLGFKDPNFLDRVYKVKKALYGLHQAPKAWYETLSTYLLDNGFQRWKIDKTLFIKRHKGDILLFQVYVDDIIFGLTKKELCNAFERLVHEKFQRSSMGELTFFLGLQFWSTAMAKTINGEVQIHARVDGKEIVITKLPVRRDLQLVDEECIDCLSNSTIFEQLALMGIGKGFSGRVTLFFQTMVIQNQSELGEGLAMPTDPHHTPTILQPSSSQPQKTQKPRKPKRKDTHVPQPSNPTDNVVDEAVYKELGDRLVRAATTASSLEAEQKSGNITKTQSKATPNESSSLRTNSGGSPRGNTLQIDEDIIKLDCKIDADHQLAKRLMKKRAGEELIQESTKKQKMEDNKEKAELKQLMETILDEEEVAIDVIPLAIKSPKIVDWKIHKEGKKRLRVTRPLHSLDILFPSTRFPYTLKSSCLYMMIQKWKSNKHMIPFHHPQVVIALPAILPPSPVLSLSSMFDSQDLFSSKEISPKDTETPVESPILVPPSSSEGSSLDYLFDESIFVKLDNSLYDHWEINQSLRILTSQMLVRIIWK
uniref:Putative ribonuclease H-like domain-containing protein n=1 Tax=Tanacetum cinerariifolium TaxID=118510 RepID=A0A699GVA0_TANCI|nr:putative ribonuclease H-like domain-containing protein [Tanacetum cinerariifolium]